MKKLLIKDIMGRLGNILFSYVCGYYNAIKQDRKLVVKTWGIPDGYLQFVIDNGFIPNNLVYLKEPVNCVKQPEPNAMSYMPIIDSDENIFVEGYRQSPKYWNNDEQFVWNLIKPKNGVIEKIKETYKDIDFENTVSINIRRGDYTTATNIQVMGLQKTEYYVNAIETCGNKKTYLVVSDDIDWCKNTFKDYDFVFVDRNIDGVDDVVRDFWIQSLCKENIISNSTFGWWPAYLNKHADKKVYYPNPWLKGVAGNDIIPDDNRWIKIKSEFV